MRRSPNGREYFVKVAIAGAPGAGTLSVLEGLASRHGAKVVSQEELGEAKVHRARWTVSGLLGGGRSLTISVVTLDGVPGYAAAEELLMREADGVIFVIDVQARRLKAAWATLLRVAESAQQDGYDLRSIPFSFQYHRVDRLKRFDPAKLDAWLGLPKGRVSRFVTESDRPDGEGMAFDTVLGEIVERVAEVLEVG